MPEMIVFILKSGRDVWIKVTFSCDYLELLHIAIFRVVSQIKAFAKGFRDNPKCTEQSMAISRQEELCKDYFILE